MSLTSLKKEDFENILTAFESGEPPNTRYLSDIYTGRKQIIDGLLNQFRKSVDGSKTEYAFINGERGQGKTMTALTVVQIASKELRSHHFIPVYIDLGGLNNPLEIFRHIFLTILTGSFTSVEFNDPDRNRLLRLMESFILDLNYHKLLPRKSTPPTNLIGDLCDIVADLNVVVCLIVDELDFLDTEIVTPIIEALMEIFRKFNSYDRLHKIWLFCSTVAGESIFQKLAETRNAFATRIYQAYQRIEKYKLRSLTDDEVSDLIDIVAKVFMKTKGQDKSDLDSTAIYSINKMSRNYSFPRDIIGNATSMLHIYKKMENILDKGYTSTLSFGPLNTGIKIDESFKNKLLPLFSKLSTAFEFNPNPPKVASLIKPEENRNADGLITFSDRFKVFIEIKYSETDATLKRKYLDQIISSLMVNKNSCGVFLLFGTYSEDPVREDHKGWLEMCEVNERIKYFILNDLTELEFVKRLILGTESTNDNNELYAACQWILGIMGVSLYFNELSKIHIGNVEPKTRLHRYFSSTPGSAPASESQPRASSTTEESERIIRLTKGLISGLGSISIEKLKKFLNITTVNQLITTNHDTIAGLDNVSPKQAKSWIDQGNSLLK